MALVNGRIRPKTSRLLLGDDPESLLVDDGPRETRGDKRLLVLIAHVENIFRVVAIKPVLEVRELRIIVGSLREGDWEARCQ